MEGLFALIICGSILYTPGTWVTTRLLGVLLVPLSIVYGYTPLRLYLGWLWMGMLCLTLVLWVVNVIALFRKANDA